MVSSMTGYGRANAVLHGRDITAEIRSVNSRFFEYSSRMPRSCLFLDDKLKKLINEKINRGKLELSLQIVNVGAAATVVDVNMDLARSYRQALRSICNELDLKDTTSVDTIGRFPDVLTVRPAATDEDELWNDISGVCSEALTNFIAMRETEGEKLKADILNKLSFLEKSVSEVEKDSEGRVKKYTERLYAKLKELLEDRNIDDSRILTEAAIFGDKTAVDEETVRLRSHIQQYRDTLAEGGPVGRKLDFLTQEMNRETNTIGSKCQDIEITRIIVAMKAEIEKIREQIQNLE